MYYVFIGVWQSSEPTRGCDLTLGSSEVQACLYMTSAQGDAAAGCFMRLIGDRTDEQLEHLTWRSPMNLALGELLQIVEDAFCHWKRFPATGKFCQRTRAKIMLVKMQDHVQECLDRMAVKYNRTESAQELFDILAAAPE